MGETSYFKPPWLYWAMMSGWSIFGFNLFGTFVPSALATALSASVIDSLARKLGPRAVAVCWHGGGRSFFIS
jgi:4-amino-4-deoxy-L-arabinose transferase-like glycosyltransferase